MTTPVVNEIDQEMIPVSNLDEFVNLLVRWHNNKVARVQHMLTVPDGMEMQLADETPLVLTGDVLKAFRVGIELGLMEFGTLPFVAQVDDAPSSERTGD